MIDSDGLVTATATAETIRVRVEVAETDTYAGDVLTAELVIDNFVDFDGDGLIDIHSLTMLHNMRHNLAGTSYKGSGSAMGIMTGCPDATPENDVTSEDCIGYELMSDLDFDLNGDGTWTESGGTYVLDNNDNVSPYFVVSGGAGGWEPIGDRSNPFTATFEGNGFVIRNLAIRRNQRYIGLFGRTHNATLRNLGLEQALADYTGSNTSYTAPLVGQMVGGTLTASYATGTVNGGGGDSHVGGLVGSDGRHPHRQLRHRHSLWREC